MSLHKFNDGTVLFNSINTSVINYETDEPLHVSTKKMVQVRWVLRWMDKYKSASVVDAHFQENFWLNFGGEREYKILGAQPVKKAQRLLKSMSDDGLLKRSRIGLPQMGEGWPSWVHTYEMSDLGAAYLKIEQRGQGD